jgi:hypothetical protein
VREHNEKIPRAVLGARTPDEAYFGREEGVWSVFRSSGEKRERRGSPQIVELVVSAAKLQV